jgi:hypothetical protein
LTAAVEAVEPRVDGETALSPTRVRRLVALALCFQLQLQALQLLGLLSPRVSATTPAHQPFALGLAALALLGIPLTLASRVIGARPAAMPAWRGAELGLLALGCYALAIPPRFGALLLTTHSGAHWLVAPWLAGRLPAWMEGIAPSRRSTRFALGVVCALGLVQGARLTTFMAAPKLTSASIYHVPGLPAPKAKAGAYTTITTYVRAASVNRESKARNVYEASLYPQSPNDGAGVNAEQALLGLGPDGGFIYPPTFLLLPRGLLALTSDLLLLRFAWFVLQIWGLMGGYAVVVGSLPPAARLHALKYAPLFFGSFTTLIALEVGNYHVLLLPLTLVGLVCAERGRPKTAGLLLAVASLTKLYPAVLLPAWLLWRRRAALTAVALLATLLLALTYVVVGRSPFVDFARYAVPRMLDRQAFPFLHEARLLPGNFAAEALLQKLHALGVAALSEGAQHSFGRAFLVGTLVLTLAGFATVSKDTHTRVLCALGSLNLAVIATPWAPGYVVLGVVLLIPLLPPERRPPLPVGAWPILCALLFCPDLPFLPSAARSLYTGSVQCVGALLSTWCVLGGVLQKWPRRLRSAGRYLASS